MQWIHQLIPLCVFIYIGECHVAIHERDFFTHSSEDHHHGAFVSQKDELIEDLVSLSHHHEQNSNNCTPMVSCPAHVRMEKVAYCKTKTNKKGVLCTTGYNHTENTIHKGRGRHMQHLDTLTISALEKKSTDEMSKLKSREATLLLSSHPPVLNQGPATFSHFRNSRSFDISELSQVMNVANSALELAIATKAFKDRQGLSNEQLEMGYVSEDLSQTVLGHACVQPPYCPMVPDRFRRIDGACNNVLHPTWGAPFTPYCRVLPASYHDGVWSPRVSVVGEEPLPSPRLISTSVMYEVDTPNHEFTLAVTQFGQFLSHDFTHSMDMSFSNGSAISCCDEEGTSALPAEATHYACMPIAIPENDPFFSRFHQRCMNFVRSVLAPSHECTLGYVQQMNKVTHFIDVSQVYGSTPQQTGELRSFHGGKLKVFEDYGRELPPLSKDPEACLTMEQGSACFESGDTRTNQMITLVVMHTLFLREHNRLATVLAQLNPHWNDEQLFLEARQILIAQMQVIVYKEYLPTILGMEAMDDFELHLVKGDAYSYDYNPQIEPAITNELAAAAFRFGHSAVDGQLKIYGPQKMEEMIAIPEVMFYPARMRHQEFFDEILNTITTEPIQDVDVSITNQLTKYMFRGGNPFGVDLAAINIQRSRDHGLRPYNDYRELTGLPRIRDFNEYGPELGEKLRSVYKSPDDMDLWVGGLLEEAAPGSLVGPTFRDIIADQFARLKKGDRYFFENDPSINPGYFTMEQLHEVRKASLSRIICDNSDKMLLSKQARNAFRKPGVPGNEFVYCHSHEIPSLDLTLWQD